VCVPSCSDSSQAICNCSSSGDAAAGSAGNAFSSSELRDLGYADSGSAAFVHGLHAEV
jgi:hypothetical protein